jgi:protein-tyrosine-phosphatase
MDVQFICFGNAFRSIIAEAYLRSLQLPGVTVSSRGTVGSQDKEWNREAHQKTLALLARHGIGRFAKQDYGEDVSQAALNKSDVVVFMDTAPHRAAAAKFTLPAKTYVWHIADVPDDITTNSAAAQFEHTYTLIAAQVDALVAELKLG